MKRIVVYLLLALPASGVSPKVATAAAVTTIGVNIVTLDKTAKSAWKGMRAAKKATVKAARKVAGK